MHSSCGEQGVQTHLSWPDLNATVQTWIFSKISLEVYYKSTISYQSLKSLERQRLWKLNEENLLGGEKKNKNKTTKNLHLPIFVLSLNIHEFYGRSVHVFVFQVQAQTLLSVLDISTISLFTKKKKNPLTSGWVWVMECSRIHECNVTCQTQGKLNSVICTLLKTTEIYCFKA